uniref:Uncharacterized protein n=1 Tax=Chromera velia CCMP2878 TaxID=1169474 RepID=A0A0G4IC03_9ALVE|eukprot:Cvel_12990.t1-p1 / transcript=Cvel_12990.t1 / gene=Cvel_12990 / organism=Chromera_velia_CCMP2878 / gene_product=hypothetical protein / transcript_product=hypothetical protein / location=Cvel_scaffold871:7561-9594(+) / protein_length=678 / sequence_SO=supercontig / SO=protein_coding / is_pseudo=false
MDVNDIPVHGQTSVEEPGGKEGERLASLLRIRRGERDDASPSLYQSPRASSHPEPQTHHGRPTEQHNSRYQQQVEHCAANPSLLLPSLQPPSHQSAIHPFRAIRSAQSSRLQDDHSLSLTEGPRASSPPPPGLSRRRVRQLNLRIHSHRVSEPPNVDTETDRDRDGERVREESRGGDRERDEASDIGVFQQNTVHGNARALHLVTEEAEGEGEEGGERTAFLSDIPRSAGSDGGREADQQSVVVSGEDPDGLSADGAEVAFEHPLGWSCPVAFRPLPSLQARLPSLLLLSGTRGTRVSVPSSLSSGLQRSPFQAVGRQRRQRDREDHHTSTSREMEEALLPVAVPRDGQIQCVQQEENALVGGREVSALLGQGRETQRGGREVEREAGAEAEGQTEGGGHNRGQQLGRIGREGHVGQRGPASWCSFEELEEPSSSSSSAVARPSRAEEVESPRRLRLLSPRINAARGPAVREERERMEEVQRGLPPRDDSWGDREEEEADVVEERQEGTAWAGGALASPLPPPSEFPSATAAAEQESSEESEADSDSSEDELGGVLVEIMDRQSLPRLANLNDGLPRAVMPALGGGSASSSAGGLEEDTLREVPRATAAWGSGLESGGTTRETETDVRPPQREGTEEMTQASDARVHPGLPREAEGEGEADREPTGENINYNPSAPEG